ncbi:hypothetical protein M501DRAFT_924595 [Patellaria atrata CBS 101060]|uniref:PLC-like phosphodiesterase n=1 Tax=Patellaria atrata CBS 101060 TaxID=1346257 RepID=A0A9P4VTQ1_9PEZI|nr:hypothetical protein M501DRAFT_924595 [Patellaria atrata CBS 101060]
MYFKSFAHFAFLAPYLLFSPILAQQQACNNSPLLCDRSYANVTQLGAHNSAFIRDESNNFDVAGNQYFNSTEQLDAGVRLLTAQVHRSGSSNGAQEWHLCHSVCELMDAGRLSTWLSGIKRWLDNNENDVVTILLVNADGATASDLDGEFQQADIVDYSFVPADTTQPLSNWPTLREMIASNTRLVTFIASLQPSQNTVAPYLLDEFTFIFENDFENFNATDFDCNPARPGTLGTARSAAETGRLFLMNHFLYEQQLFSIEVPFEDGANVTNSPVGTGSLGDHSIQCTRVYGRPPWAVLVDFFNVGPAIDSVDALNSVQNAVGRKSVSNEVINAENPVNSEDSEGAAVSRGPSLTALVFPLALAILWIGAF